MGRIRENLEIKFWRHTMPEPNSGCWLWVGDRDMGGYGILTIYEASVRVARLRAHRLSYELFKGPLSAELDLDHLCHTYNRTCEGGRTCVHRCCVNPDHVDPVTKEENGRRAGNRISHCPRGHLYSADNIGPSHGGRRCLTCHREKETARYHAHHPDAPYKPRIHA